MAMTLVTRVRLDNASFTQAYENQPVTWQEIAEEALEYVRRRNADPRPDDIAPHVALALRENNEFGQVMSDKRQRAQHFYREFADLIVDRGWKDFLEGGSVTWPR